MPTKRRRHSVTETPPVQAALDELRQELGDGNFELSELVVIGAREKLASVRDERSDISGRRGRLADRVRRRQIGADIIAANEVRRSGWVRS